MRAWTNMDVCLRAVSQGDGDRPKDMQTEQLLQLREELDELIGMRQELAPCLVANVQMHACVRPWGVSS